ncbi:shikimate dehydrogenase [Bacillaceae bacterium W0354]
MYRFGLIGNPVKHSASPMIHNTFFEQVNLLGRYELFEINEFELEDIIEHFIHNQFVGFNVTIPYKEKIIPLLNELDESARQLQAVNTVKITNGKLIGYNTDGIGYVESLKSFDASFFNRNHSILIIGAGGAAKGIYYTLQNFAFKKIDLANRNLNNAKQICQSYNNSQVLTLSEAEQVLGEYDLIIQTTPVGMNPYDNEQILSLKNIKTNTIVSDIVYNPKWTKFLLDAKQHGARILFGESMLWYQAKKAFEIWTNKKINMQKISF